MIAATTLSFTCKVSPRSSGGEVLTLMTVRFSLKIIHDTIKLIIGSVRAITGHFVIDLLPAAARSRRRKKLGGGVTDRANRGNGTGILWIAVQV